MKTIRNQRFQLFSFIMVVSFVWLFTDCSNTDTGTTDASITIENKEMRLEIGSDGIARSLFHKSTGQECLIKGVFMPAFAITQDRPYDNEIMLAYPAKAKTFFSDSVYREGDNLIISFELTDYVATVGLEITDSYIGFTLKSLEYHMADFGVKRKTLIDEFTLLQLPVKERANFGEWLNVSWDEDVAVNLLATNRYTKIDAQKYDGFYQFTAGAEKEVRLLGTGAALITTEKKHLLDRIDQVERDYGLPLGVESRRSKEYKSSYYELRDVTPGNIDAHIAYAKLGGFRQMVLYYTDFAKSMGHFPWRPEYPNGMADLQEITRKIAAADMITGFHIHYSKAQINDPYVTPVPDRRLNLRQVYTLAKDLGTADVTIEVEENPEGATMDENRRVLKIGEELIVYESYTTNPPYRFINCQRGALDTRPTTRPSGDLIGLLDVDTWPIFVRFNPKTSIQKEVAERLALIVKEAGIKFIYYDGAEDVPPPYWFNVSNAQMVVHEAMETKPLFSEAALKSHFSWHIITRGNAFDHFPPEVIKEATRKHPLAEMELVSKDFTSIDFGWIGYVAPGEETIGIQPDMLEYVTSRAAGWNSIISMACNLNHLDPHPRTADNLEVIRRWEEIRLMDFLSNKQKTDLQDPFQEHTLLINEKGNFELVPYSQLINVAGEDPDIRAFLFTRNEKVWIVYWHCRGEATLKLQVDPGKVKLFKELGEIIPLKDTQNETLVPVGDRRYISFDLTRDEVVQLLKKAVVQE